MTPRSTLLEILESSKLLLGVAVNVGTVEEEATRVTPAHSEVSEIQQDPVGSVR